MIILQFDKGTLLLNNLSDTIQPLLNGVQWDDRIRTYRAPAHYYRNIVLTLRQHDIPYKDQARAFQPHPFPLKDTIVPRNYQQEALNSWLSKGSRGVVALPTGSGKTILAVLLIEKTQRPTLVHVPTIDLMHQWYSVLKRFFGEPIGLLGGGYREIHPLTVATYDSALINVPYRGNQFGLLVFDECHHLPGEQYQYLALGTIAPFILGLTATPERNDGRESLLYELCGPLCYQAHIDELEGHTLAPYEVITLQVEMENEEKQQYEIARKHYVEFLQKEGIDFGHPQAWNNFIRKTSRSTEGRMAFQAYLTQKKLSQASSAKEKWIWDLIQRHRGERIIIFTQDNEMAYRIGGRFFLPVLTHHTRLKERESFLEAFRNGTFSILITSKVLNEGVDVPEANVAIIVSGSGSIREHVQRLGRILRARPGKQAYLYELVSKGTGEHYINKRRRQHRAYKRSGSI